MAAKRGQTTTQQRRNGTKILLLGGFMLKLLITNHHLRRLEPLILSYDKDNDPDYAKLGEVA